MASSDAVGCQRGIAPTGERAGERSQGDAREGTTRWTMDGELRWREAPVRGRRDGRRATTMVVERASAGARRRDRREMESKNQMSCVISIRQKSWVEKTTSKNQMMGEIWITRRVSDQMLPISPRTDDGGRRLRHMRL